MYLGRKIEFNFKEYSWHLDQEAGSQVNPTSSRLQDQFVVLSDLSKFNEHLVLQHCCLGFDPSLRRKGRYML